MINLNITVRIARPIEETFAYVSDLRRFPAWNSAVRVVRATSEPGRVGSTYEMERDLPTGPARNALEIVALDPPAEFAIRTTSGPTPFLYRYRFTAEGAETLLELEAQMDMPRLLAVGLRRGIEANLATLVRELGG
jgi:uncharacterized protein YndB with AHSA1/START domain